MAVDPYDLLTRIEHASDEIDRLDRQISRLSADRCRHEQARNHAVAAIDPLLAKLPPDAVVELHGVAYWIDPEQGFASMRLVPWTDLVTDDEALEPIKGTMPDPHGDMLAQIDEAAAHQAILDAFSTDEDSDITSVRTIWGPAWINGGTE